MSWREVAKEFGYTVCIDEAGAFLITDEKFFRGTPEEVIEHAKTE